MRLKFLLRWGVWLLFPVLLWWAWHNVPLAQVSEIVSHLKFEQLLVLIVLNLALTLLFSLRWWLILRALNHPVSYLLVSAYRLAGFAVSFLTPGPQFGGEPLQIYSLTHRHGIESSTAFASVMLDKTLELMVNFSFVAFGGMVVMALGMVSGMQALWGLLPLVGLLLLPLGYLVLLWLGKLPLSGWAGKLIDRFPHSHWLQRGLQTVIQGECLMEDFTRQKPDLVAGILVSSSLIWGLAVFEYWLAFAFLGLTLTLPQVIFSQVAARIALLLPLPGGLGALEASQVLAVQVLGFPAAYGVSVMLLARARDFSLAALGIILAIVITRNAGVDSGKQNLT